MGVNPRLTSMDRATFLILVKWVVALLVPVAIFTFFWSGEAMVNRVMLSLLQQELIIYRDGWIAAQVGIFNLCFYGTMIALAGYMVGTDSGRRSIWDVWSDIFFFVVVPLLLVVGAKHLLVGLGAAVVIIPLYLFGKQRIRKIFHQASPPPLLATRLDQEQRSLVLSKARIGGFWFATLFALVSLIVDIIFYVAEPFQDLLWVWIAIRTIILPILGLALGWVGGWVALRQFKKTLHSEEMEAAAREGVSVQAQLEHLSATRKREEAHNLIPNDKPLQSRGAWRFYLILLISFVLLYPALDSSLFGLGTVSRLISYGDLGYYIILALGLNIVVGFAGLLDLGYVAFFVLGTYTWGLIGSSQFTIITGIPVNPEIWAWLFWPMLLIAAVLAALWGVLLGAPTLRLRGDYLAIVTLGFGEIIPIVFLRLKDYTNGTNGISGIIAPASPCLPPYIPCTTWSSYNPTPYYYLILALIVLCIFANIRLRDSRLGRAWIALREDEIAASSSGINLVRTKLFAFAAGAFFSGIAGTYSAAKTGTITPREFSATDSIIYLAMVVIGGLGSIPGVVLGAIVVYSLHQLVLPQLENYASDPTHFLHIIKVILPNFSFVNLRNLIFGLLLVLIVIFRPEGLIPSARRQRELHQNENTSPKADALDEPPGSPGFEGEVSVK